LNEITAMASTPQAPHILPVVSRYYYCFWSTAPATGLQGQLMRSKMRASAGNFRTLFPILRSKSEAGQHPRIDFILCSRLLHLVVGWSAMN
jgi:hypothetical protein